MNTITHSDTHSNQSMEDHEASNQSPTSHSQHGSSSNTSYYHSSGSIISYEELPLITPYDHLASHDFHGSRKDILQPASDTSQEPAYISPHHTLSKQFHGWQSNQEQHQDQLNSQRRRYGTSEYGLESGDDQDSDEDLEPLKQDLMESSISRTSQRIPRPQSAYEIQSNNFMSKEEFLALAEDYLMSLSPKKREKALLTNSMYQKILMVLLQPKNTQVSTAQFRFWAKKMFTLSTTETHHVVCHGGKPVATKECLYDVLVYCHRKSSHGGRDKTSAEVRQHYSWVPKELIARFVKHCPLCSSRRHNLQRPTSALGAPSVYDQPGSSPMVDASSRHRGIEDVFSDHRHTGQQEYRTSLLVRHQQQQEQKQHTTHAHPEQIDQRLQSDENQAWYHGSKASHVKHYHSESSSVYAGIAARYVGRGALVHPDETGVGPPSGARFKSGSLGGSQSGPSWSHGDVEDYEDEDEDVDDIMDEDRGFDDNSSKREGSGSGLCGPNDMLLSTNHHVESSHYDDSNKGVDCSPSGLVGIPQEVRRLAAFAIAQRRPQNTNQMQDRQQSQLYQRQQPAYHHPAYISQHPSDCIQLRHTEPQPPGALVMYHPNGHVLHSRHPMHRLSLTNAGYAYGYPYPCGTSTSSNVHLSQIGPGQGPVSSPTPQQYPPGTLQGALSMPLSYEHSNDFDDTRDRDQAANSSATKPERSWQ
ncbi:hypothetical protein B0O80DRAFT_530930 [Mortierella sp. GBAus27b]|nr:hypothetical protein B0O80DRAFT_530930 [Mortierella sp. GBAus27b]